MRLCKVRCLEGGGSLEPLGLMRAALARSNPVFNRHRVSQCGFVRAYLIEGLREVRIRTAGRKRMNRKSRIPIPEIAQRLGVGRLAVYTMLERGIIPGIR